MASSASLGGDYKAMVCIFLAGGNDSYNMLIPRSDAEYNEYAQVRSNQAIPQADILPIDPTSVSGREFGLHPNLTGLQSLFQNGKAAFISNVGTLVEPVSKAMLDSNSSNLPLGLFSHIDQAMHWQTGLADERTNSGWGGRVAEIVKSMNTNDDVSMNISLGGNNVFQRGETVTEYAINNDGGVSVFGYGDQHPFLNLMTADINDIMSMEYGDLFKDAYAGTLKRSIESNVVFNAAVETTEIATPFSLTRLSQDMLMIAKAIKAREILGQKRQIFFVELGGFDNHDELLNNHGLLMSTLDNAMSEFYAATEELGVADCVTSFTISDFARTLTSNGNGTDHAWGGNAIVMGGAVKGKDMYGNYPNLGLGSEREIGGGIIIPETSADEYFAEIALWFGLTGTNLTDVFPNLGNFYSYDPNSLPVGFMNL